jgi:hypothetical protein
MGAEPDVLPWSAALPALFGLLLIVIGGVAVAALFDSSRAVASLQPGECLRAPDEDQITQIDTVSCEEPHELQVIGNVTLDGSTYPGDDGAFNAGLAACEAIFEEYVGEPYDLSRWFLNTFTPSREGWDAGDRTATCLVFQFDDKLEYVQMTGSVATGG